MGIRHEESDDIPAIYYTLLSKLFSADSALYVFIPELSGTGVSSSVATALQLNLAQYAQLYEDNTGVSLSDIFTLQVAGKVWKRIKGFFKKIFGFAKKVIPIAK